MINDASLAAVAAARWGAHFVQPHYETYSFAQLPRLVRATLGLDATDGLRTALLGPLAATYEQVILCLVDGFGWRFFRQYADSFPFLRRLAREGVVTQILSQFPSTTAAHVTTIHTGLP